MISLDYANPNRPFAEGKQNDRTTEKAGHVHHIQLTFSDAFDLAMRARPTFPKAGRKEAACDHGYKNPCKLGGGNRDPREPLGMVLRAHLEGGLQLVRRGTPTANVDIQLRIMDGKLWMESRPERSSIPIHLRCDAMSVVKAVTFSLRQQVREKRRTPDLWALREAITTFEIASMEHVPTAYVIADGMTKYNNRAAQQLNEDSKARGGKRIDVKTATKLKVVELAWKILRHVQQNIRAA